MSEYPDARLVLAAKTLEQPPRRCSLRPPVFVHTYRLSAIDLGDIGFREV